MIFIWCYYLVSVFLVLPFKFTRSCIDRIPYFSYLTKKPVRFIPQIWQLYALVNWTYYKNCYWLNYCHTLISKDTSGFTSISTSTWYKPSELNYLAILLFPFWCLLFWCLKSYYFWCFKFWCLKHQFWCIKHQFWCLKFQKCLCNCKLLFGALNTKKRCSAFYEIDPGPIYFRTNHDVLTVIVTYTSLIFSFSFNLSFFNSSFFSLSVCQSVCPYSFFYLSVCKSVCPFVSLHLFLFFVQVL